MKKTKMLVVTTIPKSLRFFQGQIQVLKKVFDVEVLTSRGESLELFCKEEDVVGHVVDMEREISLLKDLRSLINMIIKLRSIKPDCVHGNTPKGAFISMMASWWLRIPKRIYYIHGFRFEGSEGSKRRLLIWMERLTCFFATDIFVVSKGIAKIVKLERITNKKTHLIHYGSVNGLDIEKFSKESVGDTSEIRRKYGISNEYFVLGFVGRLVRDKGIENLVEVFERLCKKYNNICLLLAGTFEQELDPISDEVMHEIKTNEKIISLGWVDVKPFMAVMDLFVFPSYREGFGVSLMEALSFEVPCVASNITGCNEIIQDGTNGLLVEVNNSEELYDKILYLLENKEVYNRMKECSRGSVIDRYERNVLWQKSLEKYTQIINL